MRLILTLACFLALPLYAQSTKLDKLISEVEGQDLRTVEQALEWLSQDDPEYFLNFTLMRKSQSLQEASGANPRVILFGEDATSMMTFNGSVDQKNGSSIEAIQFRSEPSPHWEFREITFPGKNTSARVSERNPGKCAECHTSSFNPIWNDYDRWPGAFGEIDDTIINFEDRDPPVKNNNYVMKHRQMRKEIIAFQKIMSTHPRYRFLKIRPEINSPVAPYSKKGREAPRRERPNLRFTTLLARTHAKVVATRMKERKPVCYQRTKHLVLANFLGCGVVEKIRPKLSALNSIIKNSESLKKNLEWKSEGRYGWSHYVSKPKQYENSMLLRNLDIQREDWNIGFKEKHWKYFLGSDFFQDHAIGGVYKDVRKEMSELPPYQALLARRYPKYYNYTPAQEQKENTPPEIDYSYDENSIDFEGYGNQPRDEFSEICQAIVNKATEMTDENFHAACIDETPRKNSAPVVMNMCADCHSKPGSPNIPFDDTESLHQSNWQEKFKSRIHAEEGLQMPPSKSLTPKERHELMDWLGQL